MHIILIHSLLGREAPTIELYPSAKQTVTLGGNILFQCRATGGIPSPIIKWSRPNGESLPTQMEEGPSGVIKYGAIKYNNNC